MISDIMQGIMRSSLRPVLRSTTGEGVAYITEFIFTVATTADAEVFTIPCANSGVFDCVVDWGDGSTSAITAYNDVDLAHTYATAGEYTISVDGSFTNIYFNDAVDAAKVKSVDNLGSVGWTTFNRAFRGCVNMTSFTAGTTDTSAVAHLANMFYGCSSLTSANMNGFDTSAVTTMNYCFGNCTSIPSLDLRAFSTAATTTMNSMFRNCSGLTDVAGVENFDISSLDSTGDLSFFMTGATLPTSRYDALLINWDAQEPFNDMLPNFGSSTYTGGGAAAAARANLISTDLWTITDGGIA